MRLNKSWINKTDSAVRKKLVEFNLSQASGDLTDDVGTVEITLLNEQDELVAGITASIYWKQMHVDFLWVDESLRGQNKGTELLTKAEEIARQHHCRYIQLETFSFQAPEFYKKQGFTIFGILDDSPYDGAKQYFLKKVLN
ncbi:GNAT family N-acetyltransferase [Paenibacillus aceti]|uniref:N-acetyltransferase n=1 Tax=Paenibacillus aceti TaxID=1820010 RepID=A0ABQ1VNN0_9BACL|nr:GNAT family N-acetyltransferase [Paenibacillus aceti]GGF84679.1 N-acetyltransferase [Paenibacillus aceti]